MNPLAVLTDLIPAKYRKYVYALAALAAFAYGIYEAAGGDWRQFGIALVGSLVSALAHANTDAAPKGDA